MVLCCGLLPTYPATIPCCTPCPGLPRYRLHHLISPVLRLLLSLLAALPGSTQVRLDVKAFLEQVSHGLARPEVRAPRTGEPRAG